MNFKKVIRNIIPTRLFLKLVFKKYQGYKLNLNNPRSFNEKIQWLKIYNRDKLQTKLSDKCTVRDYVKDVLGEKYIIPLYLKTKNIDDINSQNIKNFPCIIKTNHASGNVFIFRTKDEFLDYNLSYLQNDLRRLLEKQYFQEWREWQYKHIDRYIIVEKLLLDENGEIPKDFKFHCINGRVEFIEYTYNRFKEEPKKSFYDTNWELLPFMWTVTIPNPSFKKGEYHPAPDNLKEMKEIATRLSGPFKYVRIDLYSLSNSIYFGEFTFHPIAGNGKFDPLYWDYFYGEKIKLR